MVKRKSVSLLFCHTTYYSYQNIFLIFIIVKNSCLFGSHFFVALRYYCIFLLYYVTEAKTKKFHFIQRENLTL